MSGIADYFYLLGLNEINFGFSRNHH
uniref:Uncharacterized protein n=1 Tax=Rhizophora mucronata TaxID=61149 RepID=A0A2P2PRC0_RHIMU